MISQEKFDEIEAEHGCGYYHVCWEKACPCAIATENKGLKKEIYESLVSEGREMAEALKDVDDYEDYNDPLFDYLDCEDDEQNECWHCLGSGEDDLDEMGKCKICGGRGVC